MAIVKNQTIPYHIILDQDDEEKWFGVAYREAAQEST